MKRKVERFVCPDVRVPDEFSINNKVKKNRTGQNESNAGKRFISSLEDHNFKKSLAAIRDLNGSTLLGESKIKHREDKLQKLGLPPAKQPTMPFGMRMGIEKGRKRREAKRIEHVKNAGIVIAKSNKSVDKKKTAKDKDSFGVRTFGGVLKIKNTIGGGRR